MVKTKVEGVWTNVGKSRTKENSTQRMPDYKPMPRLKLRMGLEQKSSGISRNNMAFVAFGTGDLNDFMWMVKYRTISEG